VRSNTFVLFVEFILLKLLKYRCMAIEFIFMSNRISFYEQNIYSLIFLSNRRKFVSFQSESKRNCVTLMSEMI